MSIKVFRELNENPIIVFPIYVRISGSINAAYLLSQLMYWWQCENYLSMGRTDRDWMDVLIMTHEEFINATKILEEKGFITVRRNEHTVTSCYSPNDEKIYTAIKSFNKGGQV